MGSVSHTAFLAFYFYSALIYTVDFMQSRTLDSQFTRKEFWP